MEQEIGFQQIGGLRSEAVDSSPLLNAAASTAKGFADANAKQKKLDAAERKKGYVVEDAEQDVAKLEEANAPVEAPGSISDFVTSDPDRPEETNQVRQLRRQGGSASVAAELKSRRNHLNRLVGAPPEDLAFIQQQYHQRGNAASAKQFLASENAAIQAAEQSRADETKEQVKAELGITLNVSDAAQFNIDWADNSPGNKYEDHKTVLSETSVQKLTELNNKNNPEGVAIRVGSYIDETSRGMIDSVINQVGRLAGPQLEAAGQQAVNQFRTQLEVRLAHVPDDQRGRLLAQAEKQISFVERLTTGKAHRDEIALHQAKATLNNTKLNARKIKAETKLTEMEITRGELTAQRKAMEDVNKMSDEFRKIKDSQLLLKSSDGILDVENMTPMEKFVYQNPEGVENFEIAAYDIIDSLSNQMVAGRGQIDIGEAGNVKLTGKVTELPTEKIVDITEAYLTSIAAGNNPFSGENGEQALKLWMDFGAQKINNLSPAQKSQAFAKLRPVMNTPEFAEIARQNPRALGPWVNLIQGEVHQKGANLLGSLGMELHDNASYKSAILGVKTRIDSDINSGAAFRRAQVEAKPEYFAEKVNAPLSKLAAKIDTAGGDSSTVLDFVENLTQQGPDRYLNFLESQANFDKFVGKPLMDSVKDLEGSGAKAEVKAVLDAAKGFYSGQAMVTKHKFANAENPTDIYNSLSDVAVSDTEHFEATGEYRLKPKASFLEAFKDEPQVLKVTMNQLSLHNNSQQMTGFRNSISTLKNITGAATQQDAYEMFTLSQPARATSSLTPSLREAAPLEGFQP